ncbi:branched-chain amino acid ABC transporter permease [Streptomyces sp. NPDC000410]|uniref:branched-chain amino acid ABC transporter permease n=1 Tax=Streptomyces sp. NPDC000410 TaxID=3154254 RepID=UPI003330B876
MAPAYQQFLLDTLLIEILLVLSVAVLFQCGPFSMATPGFTAVGAYTSALLTTEQGWPVHVAVATAALAAAALSAVFGLPVLRLRGSYLALGSLALGQVVVLGISNASFTGGLFGVSGIPAGLGSEMLVVLLVGVCLLLQLVHRSYTGRATRAVRLDERTAQGLGVHVFRLRLAVFVASGALAGLAGALEAHRTGVISPDQYGFPLLVAVFTYALVGGTGTGRVRSWPPWRSRCCGRPLSSRSRTRRTPSMVPSS